CFAVAIVLSQFLDQMQRLVRVGIEFSNLGFGNTNVVAPFCYLLARPRVFLLIRNKLYSSFRICFSKPLELLGIVWIPGRLQHIVQMLVRQSASRFRLVRTLEEIQVVCRGRKLLKVRLLYKMANYETVLL